MWPGPYGDVGGSRKYLIASCDQSLKRMGSTMSTSSIRTASIPRRRWKRRWARSPSSTAGQGAVCRHLLLLARADPPGRGDPAEHKVPLLIHQPSYSMLNRWIEDELLDTLDDLGTGCIAFSPLAQGMLTSKYLNGVPADCACAKGGSFGGDLLSADNLERIRALNAIAEARGQTPGADGDRLGAARSARHLGADRRAHRGAARRFAGCGEQSGLQAEELAEIDRPCNSKAPSICGRCRRPRVRRLADQMMAPLARPACSTTRLA
jgi:hypothetical protein